MSDPRDSGMTPTDPRATAGPARRGEVSSDATITSRIERKSGDETPPPLPPSPAAAEARRWLDRTHANPAPPPPERPTPTPTPPPPPVVQAPHPPWLVPVLLAVTMLVIGMVLGALLFGRRAKECPPAPAHGTHGFTSPTNDSRATVSTALYTATVRWSA